MSLSLYDAVIKTYLQIMPGIDRYFEMGKTHYASVGKDVNDLVQTKIYEDMLPFHFQIVCLVHMSAGAITGARTGAFGAPDLTLDLDYAGLQDHLKDGLAQIQSVTEDEMNGFVGGDVTFKAGDAVLPFKTEDFFLSFCVPHFYFHTTTAYDLLRMNGVPLGKAEFLGAARVKAGA